MTAPNVRTMLRRAVVRAGADPLLLEVDPDDPLVDRLAVVDGTALRWGPGPDEHGADGPWDTVRTFGVTFTTTDPHTGQRWVDEAEYVDPHALADDLAAYVRRALDIVLGANGPRL